jgi:hypothetical protein
MAWVKLDDQFYMNPKVLAAGPHAVALHVAGMCWVGGQLTDGRIPRATLPLLLGQAGVPQKTVARLVEVGLWETTATGWVVHDWLQWNPPAAQVRAEREAGKARAAKSRRSRGEGAANAQGTCSDPSPSPNVPTERQRRPLRSVEPQGPPAGHPAYQKADLTPGCVLCDGFGEVFDGNDRGPCPRGCPIPRKDTA